VIQVSASEAIWNLRIFSGIVTEAIVTMDTRIGSRAQVRGNDRGGGERDRSERGQALLEFGFLLPILMAVLLGMIVFGIALNNYLELTNGTTAGAQAISISRGQTLDPCGTVAAPFYAAAPNLTQANLSFTITTSTGPGGSGTSQTIWPSGASPSCPASSTTSPPASYLVQGGTVTVTVTYPCNLVVFHINYAPSTCTLTGQSAEAIQ
jgi:Flp pilus assembly protein TadG